MSIELQTKLGNVKLAISATLRNDKMNEVGKAAMAHLTFHKAPAKVEGFKDRDEAFSAELAARVEKGLRGVLEECFKDVKIETSERIKTVNKAQLELQAAHDAGKDAGLDAKVLQAMFPKLYEKPEVVEEAKEESVG